MLATGTHITSLIEVLLEKKERFVIFLREFEDFLAMATGMATGDGYRDGQGWPGWSRQVPPGTSRLVAVSNLASTALSAWVEILPS